MGGQNLGVSSTWPSCYCPRRWTWWWVDTSAAWLPSPLRRSEGSANIYRYHTASTTSSITKKISRITSLGSVEAIGSLFQLIRACFGGDMGWYNPVGSSYGAADFFPLRPWWWVDTSSTFFHHHHNNIYTHHHYRLSLNLEVYWMAILFSGVKCCWCWGIEKDSCGLCIIYAFSYLHSRRRKFYDKTAFCF